MDWLRRLLGVRAQSPKTQIDVEAQDRIRAVTSQYVQNGFMGRDEILEIVVDLETYESPGISRETLQVVATQAYDQAVQDHLRRQAEWPTVTDCDRLDAAFEALNDAGVVARQNFSCCSSCGIGEILDEMRQATAAGRTVAGYAFYHEQDTDSAQEGQGLYLSYGSGRRDKEADIEIGHVIVSKLRDAGLSAQWDGTLRMRIFVPLEWRRRMSVPSSSE